MESSEAIENPEEVADPKVGERTEFPTDPEERFASILSSIGNHAGKQITFLSIPSIPGSIITPGELHSAFLENSRGAWKTGHDVQKQHTLKSLVPIGMVAEEVVIRDGSDEELLGFTQTESGREYGDPVSKFLLKYAAEHDISLDKILGATGSKAESRAPYNRTLTLEYLSQRKDDSNIRIKDIEEHLRLFTTIQAIKALVSLQEEGLLMFESVDFEKPQGKLTYTLSPNFSGTVHLERDNPTVVLEAIKKLQESGITEFEIDTVLAEIRKDKPTFKRGTARVVLAELARDKVGYLKRGEFKTTETHSTVTILQEGLDFTNDVLIPLRTALTDTPEGKELRQKWRNIPWKQYAHKALKTHRENSRQANRTDPAIVNEKIIRIIAGEPGIRTGEIGRRLKELGLPHKSPGDYLHALTKGRTIIRKTEGKSARWFLVEGSEDTEKTSEV